MTTILRRPAPATPSVANPWVPMAVVMAATVMVSLDTTIVNVALHQIGIDLGAGDGIEWLVTSYLLGVCAAQPATGWLSDRFGRKQVFLSSVLAFTVASAACAASPNLTVLIVCRVLQGLGGGAMMPVGMAIGLDLFPRERHGRAIAVWGIAAMVAPAVGPTLGGWLVTSVSWHWLFLVNLPIGAAVVVAGVLLLPNIGHRERRPFDLGGLVLGSGGLTLAILGLAQGNDWGWRSPATVLCLTVGAASMLGFVRHELGTDHPLIDVRMFSNRPFRLAMTVVLFVVGAAFARLVFVPLLLQTLHGYSALRVGTIFIAPAVCTAIGMSIGGRAVDRVGPRRPIMIGCAVMAASLLVCSRLTLGTSIWVLVVLLSAQGVGMGLTMAPGMVAGISEMPDRLIAQASAVRSLTTQVAGALAVAVLGTVIGAAMGDDPTPAEAQHAFNAAFLVAGCGVLVALVVASRLPRRRVATIVPAELTLALD